MHKLIAFARVAAAAWVLIGAASAKAENWWYISHDANQVLLLDADTIGGDGPNRTATVRIYAVRPDSPRSIGAARIETDCAGNRVRYLHITGYTPALQVVAEGPPPAGLRDWRQLQPGQNGLLAIRFACGTREAADWRPLRLGTLTARPGDQPMLAALIGAGVPEPIAALFALAQLTPEQGEAMLRAVTAEQAAVLRRHGFPR